MSKVSIKSRLARFIPTRRRIIQLYAALLTNANIRGFATGKIYTGASKYMCAPGLNCYSCPGAAAACPLGALQNSLSESGTRTPYYVLGILALFGLIFGRTICGFLCPFGLVQELMYKIKTPKLKKSGVTRTFSYFKYVLLALIAVAIPLTYAAISFPVPAFCKYICPAGTLGGAVGLLINPNNMSLFAMLGGLFTWKFALMVLFLVACVFIYRFFCRFFCPLGAIYGFFSRIALLGVTVDEDKCTDCGLCISACKMDIRHVGDHECVHCGDCIRACPTHAIRWKGSNFFLHANEGDASDEKPSPIKLSLSPAVVAAGPETATAVESESADLGKSADTVPVKEETAPVKEETAPVQEEAAVFSESAETDSSKPTGSGDKKATKGNRQRIARYSFWGALTAVTVAVVLLVNFVGVGNETKGVSVGDSLPEFTVSLYGENEGDMFSPSAITGKIRVINYWATWCTPCLAELPYFQQLYEEYGEYLDVIAIHGDNVTTNVPQFIKNQLSEYTITFALDMHDSYHLLAGSGESTWPMTVIAAPSGKILFARMGSVTYDLLVETVTPHFKEVLI